MKAQWKRLLSLCLAAALLLCALPALAQETTELPEWTVMLYLCGTDLETNSMDATENLGEIAETTSNDQVNFIIQTGGTEVWHTQETFNGLEIASDKLQRYSYANESLKLLDEQPLDNMANAHTLTNFIAWTAEHFPAKKYALVLWDHGGGSYSGIIKDQLHEGAIMQVEDLARGLKNSAIPFETIITDACLMATLEVSQALAPYARYLIASEEVVPGEGGPFTGWLQYLYDNPSCDGAALGEAYGKEIMKKYEAISETTMNTLTYSTIDLQKIDAVSAAFDAMFGEIGEMLKDPDLFSAFSYDIRRTQVFPGHQYDLADMAARAGKVALRKETADAVVAAVNDAVVNEVHGSAQANAHGLSFYYAPQDDVARLDHFARTCKSAPYLAFLDRVSMGWTAPEWVYEQVERQPDIAHADYVVVADAGIGEDGLPTLKITNAPHAVATVDVQLLQYDKKSKAFLLLGTDVNVLGTFDEGVFRYAFDGEWPAIDGNLCQMDIKDEMDTQTLYQIPFITANTMSDLEKDNWSYQFRVGFLYDTEAERLATDPDAPIDGTYMLYGVWNETDSSGDLPSRDVWDVGDFAHAKISLLHDTINPYNGDTLAISLGKAFTFKNGRPEFTMKDLPSGTYAMAFVFADVFGNEQRSIPFEIEWNAKKQTVACAVLE